MKQHVFGNQTTKPFQHCQTVDSCPRWPGLLVLWFSTPTIWFTGFNTILTKCLNWLHTLRPASDPRKSKLGLPLHDTCWMPLIVFSIFSRDKLSNESDAIDAQMMGLTLGTIGNQVWLKLPGESANNLFREIVPQLYVL